MAAHVWMDRHSKAKLVLVAIEVIELISPQVFNVSRIDPPMRIGSFLDEHHRWQIIQVPGAGDFHKTGFLTLSQGVHPVRRMFRVIDWCPVVSNPEKVWMAIMMRKGMICLSLELLRFIHSFGSCRTNRIRCHTSASIQLLPWKTPTKERRFLLEVFHKSQSTICTSCQGWRVAVPVSWPGGSHVNNREDRFGS